MGSLWEYIGEHPLQVTKMRRTRYIAECSKLMGNCHPKFAINLIIKAKSPKKKHI